MNAKIFLIFGLFSGCVSATSEQNYGLSERIINGTNADISEIPYQISIVNAPGRLTCGGSIISSTFILTAAHCIETVASSMKIRFGSSFLEGGYIARVKSIYKHPKHKIDVTEYDYDVAILELDRSIPFTNTSKPVILADEEPSATDLVQISGWGTTLPFNFGPECIPTPRPTPASVLQVVNSTIINRDLCRKMIKFFPKHNCLIDMENLTERMLCVQAEFGADCLGDSGSPIISNNRQVGIVSWGFIAPEGFCKVSPSVMVNVANPEIRGFIRNVTKV